jgi:hypothetical protein
MSGPNMPPIARQAVASSSIAAVGYDGETQTLEIEFSNGFVYRYFGVPADAFEGLLSAESKGQFFQRAIRGRYGYAKA